MFEDWKQAWRQAVENFRRELDEAGDDGTPERTRAMRREVAAARGALANLDEEISRARRESTQERESERVCRRRESLARNIGDDETVRIAIEYATRHAELAVVLERKVEVFEAERALLARDLGGMEEVMAKQPATSGIEAPIGQEALERDRQRERQDRDFGKLERELRERAAEARLEELKRRMQ